MNSLLPAIILCNHNKTFKNERGCRDNNKKGKEHGRDERNKTMHRSEQHVGMRRLSEYNNPCQQLQTVHCVLHEQ